MPQPTENPLIKARLTERRSPYNRVVALVLCWFLGVFGVHRFYTGKFLSGVLMLLTGGGFGIWWIYDFIILLLGRFKDSEGRVLGPPKMEYHQLPEPKMVRQQLPAPQEPEEPELAPLKEPDFDLDDEVMRDPLEDKFAELEKEFKS